MKPICCRDETYVRAWNMILSQSTNSAIVALDSTADLESKLIVVQEMFASGIDVSRWQPLWQAAYRERLEAAWLPLHNLPLEQGVALVEAGVTPGCADLQSLEGPGEFGSLHIERVSSISQERIGRPFQDSQCRLVWTFGAWRIRLAAEQRLGSIERGGIAQLLQSCSPRFAGDLTAWNCSARYVFGRLFEVSHSGGAYSYAASRALARLRAWTCLSEILIDVHDSTPEGIGREAEHLCWYEYQSDGEWFHGCGFDFGLICLDPFRQVVTVLAASDTD